MEIIADIEIMLHIWDVGVFILGYTVHVEKLPAVALDHHQHLAVIKNAYHFIVMLRNTVICVVSK